MKKVLLFFVVATSLLFYLQSCENDTPVEAEKEKEEYVELGLKPKGIDISIEPIAARTSSSDMYCVQVRQYKTGNDEGNDYATWVTNDITTDKIKLLKGYTYQIWVMYIPDGQNIIEGVGHTPFDGVSQICPGLKDGICYGGKYGNHCGMSGSVRKKGDKESGYACNGYYLNDVDRYHGFVEVEATATVTLDVNLYRQMFGLDIEAKNFTEGKIRLSHPENNNIGNNDIILTPSKPSVSKVLELYGMPWYGSASSEDDVKNNSGVFFTIDYIGTDEKNITILNFNESVKRMTKVKISLDIKEILEDIQAGLNPKVITDESWEEVTYEY